MNPITRQETEALVQSWKNRAEYQGYKKGTKIHAKLEVEFFVGAMAPLHALGRSHPPVWEPLIPCGRSISETYGPDRKGSTHDRRKRLVMTLIRFRDNTYGRPCVVSAEDLLSALERDKRVVALRHPNGVKFSDDGYSQRRGGATCILLSYIPLSVTDEAMAQGREARRRSQL